MPNFKPDEKVIAQTSRGKEPAVVVFTTPTHVVLAREYSWISEVITVPKEYVEHAE